MLIKFHKSRIWNKEKFWFEQANEFKLSFFRLRSDCSNYWKHADRSLNNKKSKLRIRSADSILLLCLDAEIRIIGQLYHTSMKLARSWFEMKLVCWYERQGTSGSSCVFWPKLLLRGVELRLHEAFLAAIFPYFIQMIWFFILWEHLAEDHV